MRFLASVSFAGLIASSVAAGTQDTVTVRCSERPFWKTVQLIPELRIGALEGDSAYLFGRVRQIAVGSDGSVFVADEQGPMLRMYDSRGQFVRNVGRVGRGPGEYSSIRGLTITPDGFLALHDSDNGRITLYDLRGDFKRVLNLRTGRFGLFRVDGNGHLLVSANRVVRSPSLSANSTQSPRAVVLRVSTQGQIVDTLDVPTFQDPVPARTFVLMTGEGDLSAFSSGRVITFSPHGYAVTGFTTRYAIDLHRRAGVTRIECAYKPIAIARPERAEWEARATYYRKEGNPANKDIKIPSKKPAFREIEVGEDGRIWVYKYSEAIKRLDIAPTSLPPITWREAPTFDVFEPNGLFLGTVILPPKTRILLRRGQYLWGITRGQMDETYVVRYRLVTSSS